MSTFNFFGHRHGSGDDTKSDSDEFPMFSSPLAVQRCAVCSSTSNLLRCGCCKVVSYCGTAHQSANYAEHKSVCKNIKKTRKKLEQAEQELRNLSSTGSLFLPADVFNTCVRKFWGIVDTRDYMRARFAAADALLSANTRVAVESALGHFMDMLRLCRSDNLGVRSVVPPLMLRLGQEQECYDFLKWWATTGTESTYDWGNMSLPYLNIRGANAFEPVEPFLGEFCLDLSQLVTLTLLKLRLYLDLEAYGDPEREYDAGIDRPVGNLVKARVKSLHSDPFEIATLTQDLEKQYQKLCQAVRRANSHFWETLVDGETHLPPPHYSPGSQEEAHLAVHQCKSSWEESWDAMVMIEADTSKFVSVYEGSGATQSTAKTDHAPKTGPVLREGILDKQKGTGRIFPVVFKPSPLTASPTELFPPTPSTGRNGDLRFISSNDRAKVLVFVDGACPNNGQPDPRGGWAVVYGPRHSDVVSDRLEAKGPFGDDGLETSNRAELRAIIAALRLADWKDDGYNTIVIATDSTYVVDGATNWAQGWIARGWKTSTGRDVKNRDLWELLLGEVERWDSRGLAVQLWKIPREWNGIADSVAKEAANKVAAAEFRDFVFGSATTTPSHTAPSGQVRVLEICLEYEDMYDGCFKHLTSTITEKGAVVERATTVETALAKLNRDPAPSIILVVDGGITRQKSVYERVVDRLRGGSTVILAALFSSFVNAGEFDRFFSRLGLPWRRGSYHRATVSLRAGASGAVPGSDHLPASYSQKALFVSNIDRSDAWYTESLSSNEAAVAWTKVGSGHLGYLGDVNSEKESLNVVMAMCGLLD